MTWSPDGIPTGVGSVCETDPDAALDWIFRDFEELPWWPQMPKRTSMLASWVGRIPGGRNLENRYQLPWDLEAVGPGLKSHYRGSFAPDPLDREPGWKTFLERLESRHFFSGQVFKGQVFGPVSLTSLFLDRQGNRIPMGIGIDVLADFVVDVAHNQARAILERGGTPLIVIDEPALGGADQQAFSKLRDMLDELQSVMRVGIHCCGNADWNRIFSLGFDYVSVDAFAYMDDLISSAVAIREHHARGGVLAMGIVPTFPSHAPLELDQLHKFLMHGLETIHGARTDFTDIRRNLILTPSCGTAGHKPQRQARIYQLLRELCHLL